MDGKKVERGGTRVVMFEGIDSQWVFFFLSVFRFYERLREVEA